MKTFLRGALAVFLLAAPFSSLANFAASANPATHSAKGSAKNPANVQPKSSLKSAKPAAKVSAKFVIAIAAPPPSQFSIPDLDSLIGKILPNQNAAAIPGTETQFNIEPYLKSKGVTFPPGSFAIYDTECAQALMWNTPANRDFFMKVLVGGKYGVLLIVQVKILVVEYEPKAGAKPSVMLPASVQAFSKLLKKPMELVESTSLGIPYSAQQMKIGSPSLSTIRARNGSHFTQGHSGLDVLVQADRYSSNNVLISGAIPFYLQCRYRSEGGMTNGKPMDFHFSGQLRMDDGRPLVIYNAAIPKTPQQKEPKGIAFIVTAKIINAAGRKVDSHGNLIP